MALERCTQTPQFLDTAGGHERLGAMMDALPAHPLASGEAAQSPPEGGALGKTAKSVDQDSQNAIGVIANSPAWTRPHAAACLQAAIPATCFVHVVDDIDPRSIAGHRPEAVGRAATRQQFGRRPLVI